jgi:hypothetical protein
VEEVELHVTVPRKQAGARGLSVAKA